MAQTTDEAAIRRLVDLFTEGWNAKNGTACARPFAVDADFTNIMGLRARGRDLIARGHDEIFLTVFRDAQITSAVEGIRFIRPDVSVVDVSFNMEAAGGFPLPIRRSSAGMVVVRDGESWSIVSFRNMVPFARPVAGPLESALASAQAQPPASDDDTLRSLVKDLEFAWNAGDYRAFASRFTDDAPFIHIFGGQVTGRAAIEEIHRQIFETIYKGSRNQYTVLGIRFPRADVAIVLFQAHLKFQENGAPREIHARPTLTAVKEDGQWKFAAFQNTRITEMPAIPKPAATLAR